MIELLIILCLVLTGLLAWILVQQHRKPDPAGPALTLIQQEMNALRDQMSNSLSQNTGTINQRLDNAARLYGELRSQLGQLSEANVQIQAMVKDVSSLGDILRPPKLRGGMGEVLLENLLGEILPTEHYSLQHRFREGTIVDAIIRLKEGMVPVDAKFPLENFRRMLAEPEEERRRALRKAFGRDVKNRIEEIAKKYILPDEGTFNFALMYVPAENVYYETIVKDEEAEEESIAAYALSRRVVPVSPNSLFAYLQVIVLGLKGLRIEANAREIQNDLSRLAGDLEKVKDHFGKLGIHLGNAQKQFVDAERDLGRFEDKLEAIERKGEHAALPEPDA